MNVEPARVDQVLAARDGRLVVVDKDVGGVVDDLKRIDAGFNVRFAEAGEHWVVYHEHHDGCPHNGTGGPGSTYLVLTANASQTPSGVWTGLDARIVKRVQYIGSDGYDYAREVELQNARAHRTGREQFQERAAGFAEEAAHAIRRDLGDKSRAFIR